MIYARAKHRVQAIVRRLALKRVDAAPVAPRKWALLRPPRFGGAEHADDHNNWSRYRDVVFTVFVGPQLKRGCMLAFFQRLPPCLVGIEGEVLRKQDTDWPKR